MTSTAVNLATAAASFIGVRFRIHGRDPATGLDCVGLVAASLAAIGLRPLVPTGYQLRQRSIRGWAFAAEQAGLVAVVSPGRCGDIVVCRPAPMQVHLAIVEQADRAIHAHAGLRRVVRESLANLGPIERGWRVPAECAR